MTMKTALWSALNPVDLPTVSMEAVDVADGVTKVEKEIEIYGTMRNMDALDGATGWEIQEQWGLYVPSCDDNAGSGNVRIRMSQRATGEPVYVLTTKVKATQGNLECEVNTSADMFQLFKILASAGLRKKRYYFPIAGTEMEFEVDVFTGPTGAPVPHVKIDLELRGSLPDGFDLSSVTLPFEMSDIRIIRPGFKNDEDLAYVRQLFKTQYDLPNQCKGVASLEEFPPSGCICGQCGWGTGDCPGKVAQRAVAAEVDAQKPTNALRDQQDALVALSNQASEVGSALSYDDSRAEGRIKEALSKVTTAISGGLARLRNDDGDHEYR